MSISRVWVRYTVATRNTQRRKPMKRHLLVMATVVLAAAAVHAAGPKSEASAGPAAYARLKTLVGEWEADTGRGKVHVSYELIAGGTALVERESSDKMPAMLTVYYVDGGRRRRRGWTAGRLRRQPPRAVWRHGRHPGQRAGRHARFRRRPGHSVSGPLFERRVYAIQQQARAPNQQPGERQRH